MATRKTNETPVPFYKRPDRAKTAHDVAVEYSRKGWGKYKNRSAWEESIRYKGVMRQ